MTAFDRPAQAGIPIELTVNGRMRRIAVAPHHTLLEVLRDDLRLTGTKECCLVGECGACTVLLDGRSVDSCLVLAVEAQGGTVVTVEGLAGLARPPDVARPRDGAGPRDEGRDGTVDVGAEPSLGRLQRAFLATGAAQCGFCIPGQLMSAEALLRRTPHPTRAQVEEGLAGNLCRCAGYEQIIEAVLLAASDEPLPAQSALTGHPAGSAAGPDPAAVPDASVAPQ
jgi:aerobic carbon-monoxide dehydrogenase small subunit